MNGIINVLKPPGMSSHDVVYFIRKKYKTKKVGHTGTLDPEAAGVLPICIGKATKAVQYITDKNKKYRANIKFGITTDTYDKYGNILSTTEAVSINFTELDSLFKEFTGEIEQYPPVYSAIKYNGKKLYQYALEGIEIEVKSRNVEIYSIYLVDIISDTEIMIDVSCSKGTYIRSLCHDIGQRLGIGACMSQLVRLESSPFSISEAYTLEDIENAAVKGELEKLLMPVHMVFKDIPKIKLYESAKSSFINGNPIYQMGAAEQFDAFDINTFVTVYDSIQFLGLGQILYNEQEDRRYIKVIKQFL